MSHPSDPDRDAAAVIHVSEDEMSAVVDLYPALGAGKPLELDSIEYTLFNAGVTNGIDREAIAEGIREVERSGSPVKGVAAARGTPAVNTTPMRFEILFSTSTTHAETAEQIDYKEFSAIPIVHKNDVLARQIPRQEGQKGLTVTGKELPFEDARDEELEAGENVAVLGNGSCIARDDGRAIHEKGRVRVESALIVEKDVDFSVGNIRFPKDVVVGGSVLDDFVVETNGNLAVKGTVGAAALSAKGSVEILGGFSGKGRGTVRAGGQARIAYVDNGSVVCLGDLTVASEIVNSTVRSNGKITCVGKRGAIIGGSASAKGGIECSSAGSERSHVTRLEAGTDVMIDSRLRKAEGLISRLSERITALGFSLEESRSHGRTSPGIEKEQKELLKKLNELTVTREELRSSLHSPTGASVIVHSSVHPGAVISICGVEKTISATLGPSSFVLDAGKAQVVTEKQLVSAAGTHPSPAHPASAAHHEEARHQSTKKDGTP